jgi:putative ABC transport system permease protein
MGGFLTDLRLAVRTLAAARWTTLAAILILMLGTGVNTAVLAVGYGILLRPLPYADSSRIVAIALGGPDGVVTGVPPAEFDEWQRRLRTVNHLAAYSVGEFTIRGAGEPRVARVALVKGEFFALLGVPAEAGRLPSPGDTDWLAVSGRLAQQLVGGRSLIGSAVTVGQASYVITTMIPDRFGVPADDIVAWLPASARTAIGFADRPDARTFRLVARLNPGATRAQAEEDAARVLREIRPVSDPRDRHAANLDARAMVTPLDEVLTGQVRPALGALVAAALLVLLVACGNVASLFVGRAAAARRDLAVRVALGASRWRIVRSVLAESLVVAAAATAAGVWLGLALVRLFVGAAAGLLPRLDAVVVDAPVLAATALLAFVVALLCGALPAMYAVRGDVAPAFRTVVASSSRPARRLRAALAAGQIALSVVLLAGASLIVRTVAELLDQATGMEPSHAVTLRLVMSDKTTFAAADRTAFIRQVAERVRALPSVRAAGIGGALPPSGAGSISAEITIASKGRSTSQLLTMVPATPGYLQALGARLVRGRMFDERDFDRAESAVLLSESAARHLSPAGDALGRPLLFPLPAFVPGRNRRPQVVGVVGDIKFTGLDSASAGTVYVLWPDLPAGVGYLVARTDADPMSLAPSMRQVVRAIDPTLPVPDVRLLNDEVLASIADRRLRLIPAISFGVLALVVALVGLSAAMMRAVAERRRELAIRGALGASPGRTLRMVLGEGLRVTAAGVAAGLVVAVLAARTLASLLYGVSPYDAVSFALAAALVSAGALVVCWLVARRALRVDVLDTLRAE